MVDLYSKLTPSQWEEKIFYRAVQVKFPYQLKYLIDTMYPVKIAKLEKLLLIEKDIELKEFYNSKILRLKDKLAICTKMLSLRESKSVSTTGEWAMHGTLYYIDATNGNDVNDGLAANNDHSWQTINKYTTTTVRTAGDIAYLRANMTYTNNAADIVFDEDGTINAYTSIIGCDATTNDPWNDDSDTKPIIDFGDQQYQMLMNVDDYWNLDRLDIIQSADTAGSLYITSVLGAKVSNCVIRDNSAASTQYGLNIVLGYDFIIENCSFLDNVNSNLYLNAAKGIITGCTFNGGAGATVTGINSLSANVFIDNTTFGSTTAHTTNDIAADRNSIITTRNCTYNKATLALSNGAIIISEDDDGTKGANKIYYRSGTSQKTTAVTRTGGGASSVALTPSSTCGLYNPLSINPFYEADFKIYCVAATTVTIYIRSNGEWASYPTASTLYVEASYLNHATAATRSTVVSNDVIADGTTWVAFDVTFTPQQAGFAYIKVYLKAYEASKGIYVDILPVIT